MRFWFQAAVFLPVLASALFIPPSTFEDYSDNHDTLRLSGDDGHEHLTLNFRVSCQNCPILLEEDQGFDIEVEVPKAHQECGDRLPRINGIELAPQSLASGPVRFPSKSGDELDDRSILAYWTQACLNNEASLLSLDFIDINGQPFPEIGAGFTLSYRQQNEVEVLRLHTLAVDEVGTPEVQQAWLHPNGDMPSLTEPATLPALTTEALRDEYRKLDNIKSSIGELKHQLREQESRIYDMLKQEFHSCTGVGCLLQNAIKRLPDFAQLITAHFSHHPHRPNDMHHGPKHQNCSRGVHDSQGFSDKIDNQPLAVALDALSPPSPLRYGGRPPFEGDGRPTHGPPGHPHGPPPPQHPHGPPPPGHPHGPPPPQPPHGPPPHGHPHGAPPPPPSHEFPHPPPGGDHPSFPPPPPGHHDGRLGHGPDGPPPHFQHPHHWHRRHHFVLSAAILLVILACAAVTFKFIHKHTSLFRASRRSVDRAERREERRNRRAYRRAACRQKWKNWWNRYRQPSGSEDYEEKRAMILEQEGVLEGVMEDEVRNLRTAHQIVGDMVRAEETRQRLHREANTPPARQAYDPAELEAGMSLLPAYAPPPPTYEEDMAGEIHVVDGFTYTPSDSDYTPDSSVVDCNPRLSMDTGTTIGFLDSKGGQ